MDELIDSKFSQTMTVDGHTIEVFIYATDPTQWVLEVVNSAGLSTVWDGYFDTDQAAFAELERTLREEGVVAIFDPTETQ